MSSFKRVYGELDAREVRSALYSSIQIGARIFLDGWPTSFGGGGGDDRGLDAERKSSSPPGPKDLGPPHSHAVPLDRRAASPSQSPRPRVIPSAGVGSASRTVSGTSRRAGIRRMIPDFSRLKASLDFLGRMGDTCTDRTLCTGRTCDGSEPTVRPSPCPLPTGGEGCGGRPSAVNGAGR